MSALREQLARRKLLAPRLLHVHQPPPPPVNDVHDRRSGGVVTVEPPYLSRPAGIQSGLQVSGEPTHRTLIRYVRGRRRDVGTGSIKTREKWPTNGMVIGPSQSVSGRCLIEMHRRPHRRVGTGAQAPAGWRTRPVKAERGVLQGARGEAWIL